MARSPNLVFVDRENEAHRLREAILSRQSLMVTGASDMGKTALVRKVISELPPPVRQRCLYVGAFRNLQDLLRLLILALYEAGDRELRREGLSRGLTKTSCETWVRDLSSSRLRGTLYRTVPGKEYRFFLDHCPALTPAVARVMRELFRMRQTPVCLVTSGAMKRETAKAGHYFYWGDRQSIQLGPLPLSAAHKLIDDCIQVFGLTGQELEGFREEVLGLSQSIPGAIVTMCCMAADPRYQIGSHVKTKLIHIDYLMRGRTSGPVSARTSQHN